MWAGSRGRLLRPGFDFILMPLLKTDPASQRLPMIMHRPATWLLGASLGCPFGRCPEARVIEEFLRVVAPTHGDQQVVNVKMKTATECQFADKETLLLDSPEWIPCADTDEVNREMA